MVDGVKSQLALGLFDIVPEPLPMIFDFEELESLMCGWPTIEISNWRKTTNHSGDEEARDRLLKYITGMTSAYILQLRLLLAEAD